MTKRLTGAVGAALLGALCCSAVSAVEAPPALRLPDTVFPVSYQVHLTLDSARDDFSGSIAIRIELKQPQRTVWLNATRITISRAEFKAAGKTYRAQAIPGREDFVGLEFPSALPAGAGELSIDYTGKLRLQDSSGVFRMLDRGNRYIFTQFEDIDARAAFPCFDEPSYKVPWQLTLDVPSADTAVSNTPILRKEEKAGRTTYYFKQTKPLPSYLIAFAVGPFEYVDAGRAGRNNVPVRIVTPKGYSNEAQYAAKITATILTRLEDYFGIPYPYEKSDNVAIPATFGFGAMENAGMVTYGQSYILADPATDTTTRQRTYATFAAHELAHQWFGDLVTTAWWNDIWLNEAFATWMEQKLVAEWKPEWNTRVDDVDSKLGAQNRDRLVASRKIRQEIRSKSDISNAFDDITYQKGAAVIAMFENFIGPEAFRSGVASYLKQYSFRTATAPEFLDAISSSSKKDVTKAFFTFLNQPGVPLVSMALECRSGAATLHLEQQRSLPIGSKGTADQTWSIPLCVRYGTGVEGRSACTEVSGPRQDWTLPSAPNCPTWVEGNDKALGYYQVAYSPPLLASLVGGDVERRLSVAERVDFLGDAQSLADTGKLPEASALQLVDTFHSDANPHVTKQALGMALAVNQHLVPQRLLPNYQRFLRKNFAARAHELSWTAKPGESDDERLLRPTLLLDIATYGADMQLVRQARQFAEQWLHDHSSVNPNLVGAVMNTAAYYGDRALFDEVLADLKRTHDRLQRHSLIAALFAFREPALIEAAKDALLAGDIPFIEGYSLLFAGQSSDATRAIPLAFLEAHYQQVMDKRPTGGGFDFAAQLPRVGESYCDESSKRKLAGFFEPRVGNVLGGPRVLAQVLENIDVCIASKAAHQPGVEAFLEMY